MSSSWATGELAAASSRASRPSALPEAYCSQQPRLPHSQRWPPGHDDLVAELPRHTEAPRSSRPSITMAPPIPVPRVMQTRRSCPCPAPKRHSAQPAASASLVSSDRPAQQPLQVVPQRFVAPGQMRAEQHSAAVEVHPAGRADSDRPDPVARAQLLDQFDDDLFHGAGVVARGGPLGLGEDPALGVHHAGSDLGSADVARRWPGPSRPSRRCSAEIPAPAVRRPRPGQGPASPGGGPAAQAGLLAGCRCLHGAPSYSPERHATAAKAPAAWRGQRAPRRARSVPDWRNGGPTVKLLASRCRGTHLPGAAY